MVFSHGQNGKDLFPSILEASLHPQMKIVSLCLNDMERSRISLLSPLDSPVSR